MVYLDISKYKLINMSIAGFISFFCLLCLVVLFMVKTISKDTKPFFGRIFVCEFFLSLLLVASYGMNGVEGKHIRFFLEVIVFFQYLFGYLMWCFLIEYFLHLLKQAGTNLKIVRVIIWTIFAIATTVLFINLFFGYYYTIDANNSYVRGQYFIIHQILGTSLSTLNLILLVIYRKKIMLRQRICLFAYVGLCLIALIAQFFFYRFPIVMVSMFISTVIAFIFMISEETYIYSQNKEELLQTHAKLILSQMHPHFLFNALTTIAVLCDEDPKEAKQATMDLSKYLRSNIDSISDSSLIPFTKEIDSIMAYLRIEKRRFKDKLDFVMDLAEKDFFIPRFLLQPLIENSVKHGIFQKEGKGKVILSTFKDYEGLIHIIVEDDGVGFEYPIKNDENKVSVGLNNSIKLCSSLLNGEMKINSELNKGTKIEIKFKPVGGGLKNDYPCFR